MKERAHSSRRVSPLCQHWRVSRAGSRGVRAAGRCWCSDISTLDVTHRKLFHGNR